MMTTMRVLVIYYSKTGNTAQVAKQITEKLKSDYNNEIYIEVAKIEPIVERPLWRDMVDIVGYLFRREVEIKPTVFDLASYELVCVGGCVHWLQPCRPLESYLKKCQDLRGKKVGLFLTCGGTPLRSLSRLKRAIEIKGGEVIESVILRPRSIWMGFLGREIGNIETFDLEPVQSFVEGLHRNLAMRK